MTKQFEKLSESVTEVASTQGFALHSPLGERHGSYEMVFIKDDGIFRFLTLGLTFQTDGCYLLELYVIAEDAQNSQRELITSFRLEAPQLESWVQTPAFRQVLNDAFSAAKQLIPKELKRQLAFTQQPSVAFHAAR